MWLNVSRLLLLLSSSLAWSGCHEKGRTYYLNVEGDDRASGDRQHPWRSLDRLKNLQLQAGDTLFFAGGEEFKGSLVLKAAHGNPDAPVVITSDGIGSAVINSSNEAALVLNGSNQVTIQRLTLKGSGRKTGNTTHGMAINDSRQIRCDSLNISGFQKAGLMVYRSSDARLDHVYAHDNGYAGIAIMGDTKKSDCQNIVIANCRAENNAGDPTELNNHSGNGIIAGFCEKVRITQCTATNNGWDMPRVGNGPVGIWCYEADSVVIEYCTSFQNKTAPGAADGGGFDLDGGTTNSIIQYCLSYENQGSGYGLFQYAGASPWNNNVVRYCISKNDGNVSPAHAGVFVWNSSDDPRQLSNLRFCNNIIDNDRGGVISYEQHSRHSNFTFSNNSFLARSDFIIGDSSGGRFAQNNWIKKQP